MLKYKEISIFGYSGHAYVVLDALLANRFHVRGYYDFSEAVRNPYGISYLGNENKVDFKEILERSYYFPAIGANVLREKLYHFSKDNGLAQISIIHPSAYVASQTNLGEATFIAPKAVVNNLVFLGNGCIVNTGAIIEHECVISDFCHIAPGAVLAGNVTVGKKTFIGANATIKQGVVIGKDVIIGAGAVVLRDVPDGEIWIGNPAKLKKQA